MGGKISIAPKFREPAVGKLDWQADANCLGLDPELFFPVSDTAPIPDEVVAACADCPVRTECLARAIETESVYGYWGGLTEDERRLLIRRQRRAAAARDVA